VGDFEVPAVEVEKQRRKTYSYDLKDIRIASWLHRKLVEIKLRENFKNMSQVIRYLMEKAGEL
jgi:hypothetical protein